MNIARVIMSVGKSAIALSPFAIISIWFILTLISGSSAEGKITDFFISRRISSIENEKSHQLRDKVIKQVSDNFLQVKISGVMF